MIHGTTLTLFLGRAGTAQETGQIDNCICIRMPTRPSLNYPQVIPASLRVAINPPVEQLAISGRMDQHGVRILMYGSTV